MRTSILLLSAFGCATRDPDGSADTIADSDILEPTDEATTDPTDGTDPTDVASLTLEIPALTANDAQLSGRCALRLPVAYECDNPNPAVNWSDAPASTQAFVLIFDDPDAGDYPHWAVYDLPGDGTGIAAEASGKGISGAMPAGAKELENGFGWTGYLGSCPSSPHVYRWRLWAVDAPFDGDLSGPVKRQFKDLATWAEAHAVASVESCHVYGPATSN
jgi:Raf kinase inhibitor-like YbhB/YbcL family protein